MFSRLILASLVLLSLARPAWSLATDWQKDEAVAVRLIAATEGVGQEKTLSFGLDVQMAPAWHTYWRTPGEAGLPPQIDWKDTLSDHGNAESATLFFPAPTRYAALGMETIGYRDHVVFPIEVRVRQVGHAVILNPVVDLLVCKDLCVPKHFNLSLTVPEGEATASADADLIHSYLAKIPVTSLPDLSLTQVTTDGAAVTVVLASALPFQKPDLFVENTQSLAFAPPVATVAPDAHTVTFVLKLAEALPEGTKLTGSDLTLTFVDGERAVEEKITVPDSGAGSLTRQHQALPLWAALVFAIMGGFILNLMPCVLPVLSLKILGVISHGGGEARRVQHSFLTTAAGIIFSYLLLGGVTIALKELGMSFGWGVQFQEPLFLSFLIVLLTLFAANMWGLFEIQLPRFLVDTFDQAYHPKLAGDFATGAFATLLATPCTAPFLGTALGFALASGPRDIALIFLGLGIGMALPYLAIAAWPRFATALPRPGMWMLKLKYFLGFALAATAGWLVWVLASQIGLIFSLVMGGMMLALVGLFLMARTIRPVPFLQGFVLLAVAGALGLALIAPRALPPTVENGGPWTAFNEAELAKDVAAGKVVFVDVTADWCLTCKANKQFILAQKDIQKKLFQSDVVAMRADWTNPDSVIASFLHVHGRYGIPFNAVFGPSAPEGIVLPELLTSSAVTDALEKAR